MIHDQIVGVGSTFWISDISINIEIKETSKVKLEENYQVQKVGDILESDQMTITQVLAHITLWLQKSLFYTALNGIVVSDHDAAEVE